jgi:hypothetical protein
VIGVANSGADRTVEEKAHLETMKDRSKTHIECLMRTHADLDSRSGAKIACDVEREAYAAMLPYERADEILESIEDV